MIRFLFFIGLYFSISNLFAQHTFSILAIDTLTGEVGSAGASCIDRWDIKGGASIISEVFPARGAIHTQAFHHPKNQEQAAVYFNKGYSAQQMIDSLLANDTDGHPSYRQYGIVKLEASGKLDLAAFTGDDCFGYHGQIIGKNYVIVGNTLLGQEILDKMEEGFINTNGTLADKLMGALLMAKIPAADVRCQVEGVSSRSAFIQLAKKEDREIPSLNIIVQKTNYGVDPISVLEEKYELKIGEE